MHKQRILSALCVMTLPAVSLCQVVREGDGYLLRVRYEKGEVIKYQSVNSVDGMPGKNPSDLKILLPVVMTVTDVKGPFALVRCKVGPALNGKIEMFNPQTVMVKVNNRNTGGETNSPVGTALPLKAVKVGETWTADAPVTMGNGSITKLQAIYKFGGLKTDGGNQVAEISYSVSGTAKGTGTMLLLVKDGTIWRNQSKLSLSIGGGKPITLTSVLSRV